MMLFSEVDFTGIITWLLNFFASLQKTGIAFSQLSAGAFGSISALSVEWGNVVYIGPVITGLIGGIIAFIFIDFFRDIL